jgi:hypothetical protein
LCWYLVQRYAPQFAIPVVCVVAGGLFTVLFYRLCVMMLTSAAGMICLAYGGLDLAERVAGISTLHWLADNASAVQLGYLGSIFVGMMLQHRIEISQKKYSAWKADYAEWQKKKSTPSGGGMKRRLLAMLPKLRKAG